MSRRLLQTILWVWSWLCGAGLLWSIASMDIPGLENEIPEWFAWVGVGVGLVNLAYFMLLSSWLESAGEGIDD
jgi:hypothetical protein